MSAVGRVMELPERRCRGAVVAGATEPSGSWTDHDEMNPTIVGATVTRAGTDAATETVYRTDTYTGLAPDGRAMKSVLPAAVSDVLASVRPESSPVQREMEAHADDIGFPIVGPEVGAVLRILAGAVGATRIFEFGSGFGYSASWFAPALPEDGLIVLTEIDAEELEMGRGFLEEAGLADRAVFEHGDAFETFGRYDGPFDVVLVDCEKERYPDAIEPIREKLAPGGLVVADNALQGPFTVEDLAAGLEDEPTGEYAGHVAGIVEYLERMREDPDFETAVVPLGEGIAVSRHLVRNDR